MFSKEFEPFSPELPNVLPMLKWNQTASLAFIRVLFRKQ